MIAEPATLLIYTFQVTMHYDYKGSAEVYTVITLANRFLQLVVSSGSEDNGGRTFHLRTYH